MKSIQLRRKTPGGQTPACKECEEKTTNYAKPKWDTLAESMDSMMAAFASWAPRLIPAEAQALVKSPQNHIAENFYLCTNEILAGLRQMYAGGERFQQNIDMHAAGTAAFIRDAIEVYCQK